MNSLRRLLPVPAERELPSERFAGRKAAIIEVVGRDLAAATQRTQPQARWRRLLTIFLALLAVGTAALLATQLRSEPTPLSAGIAVAAGSAPLLASFAVMEASARQRPAVASRLAFAP